jgi:hypothetical protein
MHCTQEQASALAAEAVGAPVGFVFPKEGAPMCRGTLSILVKAAWVACRSCQGTSTHSTCGPLAARARSRWQ